MNVTSNNSPPLYDRFLLSQYTYHGDTIINSVLRGIDNIRTYRDNISTRYELKSIYASNKVIIYFACLYLGLIPQSNTHENILEKIMQQNDDIKNYNDRYPSIKLANRYLNEPEHNKLYNKIFTDTQIISRIYSEEIYPEIKKRLDASDLDYFRTMTYYIIQQLYITIKNTPPLSKKAFEVYRRVNDFYLNRDPNTISKFTTFHSTTKGDIYSRAVKRFGSLIYKFIVHPNCQYISILPYSYKPEEDEIVFAPGNRYVFLSEETDVTSPGGESTPTHMTYAILPPKEGYTLPETYQEYKAYLQTIQSEETWEEQNRTNLGRAREAMAGGTRKRKVAKRMTRRHKKHMKHRKQRGGVNEAESGQNRWTGTPEVGSAKPITSADEKLLREMGLNPPI